MKIYRISIICFCFFVNCSLAAQDTFSIVAVDTETGEVGSAGASCLDNNQFPGSGGAYIISEVIPGRGAIHTQAYWNANNQNAARTRMLAGDSPQQIITWLSSNDVQANPAIRQYGIADFDPNGTPRAAGFTGSNTDDYKNHITGAYYSIQGNILLGQQILDSMEVRFLNTPGPLADRLMAALQGANVPGADTRCLDEGVSSLSAFLRVAKTDDSPDNLYLDLNIPATDFGVEPIDQLQAFYNLWKTTSVEDSDLANPIKVYPNPAGDFITFEGTTLLPANTQLAIYNAQGQLLYTDTLTGNRQTISTQRFKSANVYFYKIYNSNNQVIGNGKFLKGYDN